MYPSNSDLRSPGSTFGGSKGLLEARFMEPPIDAKAVIQKLRGWDIQHTGNRADYCDDDRSCPSGATSLDRSILGAEWGQFMRSLWAGELTTNSSSKSAVLFPEAGSEKCSKIEELLGRRNQPKWSIRVSTSGPVSVLCSIPRTRTRLSLHCAL